jgi:hypothetical protein
MIRSDGILDITTRQQLLHEATRLEGLATNLRRMLATRGVGANPGTPAFLNLKASSLAAGSYPVEVGVAIPRQTADDAWQIDVCSALIRPTSPFAADPTLWDPEAERRHGLPLSHLLSAGTPPARVTAALDELLTGRVVVTGTGRLDWKPLG